MKARPSRPTPDQGPEDALEVIFGMTVALSRAQSSKEIYDLALDGVRRVLRADRAAILLYDASDVMRFRASIGLSTDYQAAVEGHCPWTRQATDPRPIFIEDVTVDPHVPLHLAQKGDLILSPSINLLHPPLPNPSPPSPTPIPTAQAPKAAPHPSRRASTRRLSHFPYPARLSPHRTPPQIPLTSRRHAEGGSFEGVSRNRVSRADPSGVLVLPDITTNDQPSSTIPPNPPPFPSSTPTSSSSYSIQIPPPSPLRSPAEGVERAHPRRRS